MPGWSELPDLGLEGIFPQAGTWFFCLPLQPGELVTCCDHVGVSPLINSLLLQEPQELLAPPSLLFSALQHPAHIPDMLWSKVFGNNTGGTWVKINGL